MAFEFGAVLTLKDNLTQKIRNSIKETQNLKNNINTATGELKRFEGQSRQTGNSLTSLKTQIASLAAGYLSFQAAKGVFSTALSTASDLEGYRNTLNVVMKDQKKAAETMAWATNFANKTPFETDSVVEATVRLQAYGLEARKVLPAIGDMAGVMNKDIMQAVEAVADAQTGELERLKEFGITKAMIAKKAGEMYRNQEIINNKGQIVDQQKFNNALFALMEERFKGGMEIQSNTFKGLWSTVTGVFKTSLAQMMGVSATGEIKIGGLFDTIKNKIKVMADTLTKWSQDGTIDKISANITAGVNALGNAFKWAKDNADWLIPAIGGVTSALVAMKVINTVNALMTTWKTITQGQTIAQWALNAAMRANPLMLIVTGIGLVVTAGIYLWRNWDTIKEKAEELWQKIKEIWTNIKNLLKNPIKGFVNLFQKNHVDNKKTKVDGSHYSGLKRVPYDGYIARLHKGERVLTKQEAKEYNSTNNSKVINLTVNINGASKSTNEIINELVPQLKLAIANAV
jgi:phage tail tape-measure protein